MPSKQFPDVNSRYGAPLGRRSTPSNRPEEAASVRLFRVRIDAQGYDDGGAYWGLGEPLWCCTDDGGYQEFIRAGNRFHAAAILGLHPAVVKVKITLPSSYQIAPQWRGHPEQRYCLSYRGVLLDAESKNYAEAFEKAQEHYLSRKAV